MRKLRVLVADDHAEICCQIALKLSREFEVVGTVADGKSVVLVAPALNPDVIVSDVFMPVLTGPQAMKELSAHGYNIPFVLVSAEILGVEEFIQQGAKAFVDKIDLAHELAPAVRSAAAGQIYISRSARSLQYQ